MDKLGMIVIAALALFAVSAFFRPRSLQVQALNTLTQVIIMRDVITHAQGCTEFI
jgi:hypothetical protein